MKILFVGMSDSVHAAKWIGQLDNPDWKIFLFPVFDILDVHPKMPGNVKVCIPGYGTFLFFKRIGMQRLFRIFYYYLTLLNRKINPDYYSKRLSRTIRRIGPDLIHSLETQGAGYLVEEVRRLIVKKNRNFPKWWHSNWGSDISLFGRLPEHQARIREVMAACDYYFCECDRDVKLAREFGFTGEVFPIYPNAGGFNIKLLERLRKESAVPSLRKTIMLKGYQSWYGRALTGIRALERCADILEGYQVVMYTNTTKNIEVGMAASLFTQSTGIEMKLLPPTTSNEEILKYHGLSRISISLSTCDGISTSALEAMALGSFPIQSNTSCVQEWITDGESGILVPPEDTDILEQAIRKAIADDELVNKAAEINFQTIKTRADYDQLKELTHQAYLKIQAAL